ncbi:hypothetical protein ENSA7_51390 [Enhygromyxa salina]|uniref:HEAT repeat protein n=2 Tax=Enhygromyxa salina TaxID=215803 RepID=A0A2S9YFW3_9BACT|nr:hypothetical protein ENSA7_51390 [Enhygromyxa salina]
MRLHSQRTAHHWIFTGALALTAVSGCSVLGSVAGPSSADLDRAFEQRDLDYLENVCAKGRDRESRDFMRGSASDQEDRACTLASDVRGANDKDARAQSLAEFEATLTCDNAIESLRAYGAEKPDEHDYARSFHSVGAKVAECQDYAGLVTELLPLAKLEGVAPPESMGKRLLNTIGESDASLATHIAEVANADSFSFEASWVSAGAISSWLLESSSFDTCASYVAALGSPHRTSVKTFIEFLGLAKCSPAAGAIASHLSSEDPEVRVRACQALGRLTDPAYADKLRVVAESDSAYTTNGLVQTYYVRDACRDALGKTKLAN